MLADLSHEVCGLNHGPGAPDHPALDYLVCPVGYRDGEVSAKAVRELIIPVCLPCSQALTGDDWTLLYCFECGASRWVARSRAKNSYRHHVLWLRGCPDCTKTFGGLYFND